MAREGMVAFTVELPILDMDRLKSITQDQDLRLAQLVRRAVRDWLDRYLTDQAAREIHLATSDSPRRTDTRRINLIEGQQKLPIAAKTADPNFANPQDKPEELKSMTRPKTYLGDGAYAEIRSGELILTTENGVRVTNTIVLEPDVLSALLVYLGFPEPKS